MQPEDISIDAKAITNMFLLDPEEPDIIEKARFCVTVVLFYCSPVPLLTILIQGFNLDAKVAGSITLLLLAQLMRLIAIHISVKARREAFLKLRWYWRQVLGQQDLAALEFRTRRLSRSLRLQEALMIDLCPVLCGLMALSLLVQHALLALGESAESMHLVALPMVLTVALLYVLDLVHERMLKALSRERDV